jgi:hypothetical protein
MVRHTLCSVPRLFVSYSWADRDLAARLAGELEKRRFDVWLDGHRASPGENLDRAIRGAIDRARACVVVVSPATDPAQPFVSKEWSAILEASWQRAELKLCPLRVGNVELPPFLRRWRSVDIPEVSPDLGPAADQIAALVGESEARPPAGAVEQERARAAARIAEFQNLLYNLKM